MQRCVVPCKDLTRRRRGLLARIKRPGLASIPAPVLELAWRSGGRGSGDSSVPQQCSRSFAGALAFCSRRRKCACAALPRSVDVCPCRGPARKPSSTGMHCTMHCAALCLSQLLEYGEGANRSAAASDAGEATSARDSISLSAFAVEWWNAAYSRTGPRRRSQKGIRWPFPRSLSVHGPRCPA